MKIARYWNTVKYLKPLQIEYQIINRLKNTSKGEYKDKEPVRKVHLLIESLDLEDDYISRFKPEEVLNGKVRLLNRMIPLDYSKECIDKLLPLYQFNLLYFEYAIAWGATYKKTGNKVYAERFQSYFKRYLAEDLPYYSYVCSLQIPNLIITLELFGDALKKDFIKLIYKEIYRQYQYIEHHLELHLLGNHYFENLKALVITSYLFGEDKKCKRYYSLLEKELQRQILPDGMHFELSPMYHKIILEDILRLKKLPYVEGIIDTNTLNPIVKKMGVAMLTLEDGFSRTPLFNDSGDNVAKMKDSLIIEVEKACQSRLERKNSLPEAGYYRLQENDILVLFDAGKIGPEYMPGHGHCDCLSYELVYKGELVIVNAGTYQYQGDERAYYRSTRAHNTLQILGEEQSEVWGEHRVARRIKNVKCEFTTNSINSECTTYKESRFIRKIWLDNLTLNVLDYVEGNPGSQVVSYIHIAPGFDVREEANTVLILKNNQKVSELSFKNSKVEIIREGELVRYAPEFGLEINGITLVLKWNVDINKHGYSIAMKR